MARLIYGMIMSLDGYTEDEHGRFGWGAPEDEGVHSYVNELASSVGTYLYGRRMYEMMVYWETVDVNGDQPSGSLMAMQCDASKPIARTTSPLTVLSSPRRRFALGLSMSSR